MLILGMEINAKSRISTTSHFDPKNKLAMHGSLISRSVLLRALGKSSL